MGELEDIITSGPVAGGAGRALTYGLKGVIKEFLKSDAEDRLLLLLGDTLRDKYGTKRGQFKHWKKNPEIEDLLGRCIYRDCGDSSRPAGFNHAIARQLQVDKLPELASNPRQIVDVLWQLAPLTVDSYAEGVAVVLNQIEASQSENREDLRAIRSLLERSSDSSAGEALVRGPAEHANADKLVSDAEEVAEANPENAVSMLLDASEKLRKHGLYVGAESVEQRAAEILEKIPDRSAEALNLRIQVARDQMNRGSGLAQSTFGSIERSDVEKPEWFGNWMNGMRHWPIVPDQARKDLLTVVRSDDSPLWAMADAAEVLLLLDGVSEARHQLLGAADESEDGIRIKLCLADADHEDWDDLVAIAARSSNEMAAIIYARHGRHLAHRDQSAESVESLEKSMDKWSRVPNADEQIASAFYSAQIVAQTSQDLADHLNFDLWPLAYELRSPVDFPEARGNALETQGMSNRLNDRPREAVIAYATALLVYRKSGSLNSEANIHQRLGELHESIEEYDTAIRHYINAGKGESAKKIARKCDLEKLEEDMDLTVPSWHRVAIYSILGEIGEVVSPSYVERNLEKILSDVEDPTPKMTGLITMGSVALSTVSTSVPEGERHRVRALVVDQVTNHLGHNEKAAARALELGTEMGIWDESELLLDVYLEEPNVGAVDAGWIADVANRNESIASQMKEAARAGSTRALYALSIADIKLHEARHLTPSEMQELCDNYVRSRLGQSSVEDEDGTVTVSGIHLDRVGSIALRSTPEVQGELVDDTLRIVTSANETENFRASAMSTLDDLVPSLSDEKAVEVADVVSRLAAGEYILHAADHNHDHPFSAARISLHVEGYLQACSTQCAASLEKRMPGIVPDLKDIVLTGLSDTRFTVIRGALIAAEYVPEREYSGLLMQLAGSDKAMIRSRAFAAINAGEVAAESFARKLARDPAPLVRAEVLDAVLERNDPWAQEILRDFEADPDAYLRMKARQAG